MTRKNAKCYKAVFDFIEKNLFELQPNKIMTDYESGMRFAIKEFWPGVSLHGCWFHFCRAIRKRCQKNNLTKLLRQKRNAQIIQKSMMSIPLLPAERIKEGYDSIKQFARKKKLFQRFSAVFKYFESYWMKQVRRRSCTYFQLLEVNLQFISQNERNTISVMDLNMRTTSSVEALNSVIQRSFPGQTTIFRFIESLRLHESIKSSDLYQLSLGEISNKIMERRRALDRHRDVKIKRLTTQLKNGEISVNVFLEAMSEKDVLPHTGNK